MSTNRRSFLSALGATGAVSAIAASKAVSQTVQSTSTSPPNAPIFATPSAESRALTGKVAIVTGARANLGRAFALAFARQGADVVVHYHRAETIGEAEETARLVREQGSRAALAQGDLGQATNVKQMFDVAFNEFGRVDILVNNAGAIVKKPIADVTDEDLEQMININTRGNFLCTREAARRLADNGRIINIATSLLAGAAPNYAAYAGSKAIVEEMTRMGARELGGRGITVNSVAPGPVDTPFFHSMETPQTTEFAANLAVARRLGMVSDIVPLVEFLALPSAQWITGQTIWINGGYLTR
ncbi:SDR family oxidoreductase [Nodosilinea sp. LEGE 07088]|uniref:SDR family oxidoreductase n=1 Tax=Nodosilinea sp. LEGE 07088 TaxID=2777968 RepID=UPI0018800DFF|nr:SDR family oxidoreductase [Nodosilinea sp. LEGE 07088]MBE9141277.1 SDR family oxidoreductase [Nodosilinea sp. LEGE 07088]